jgi:cold shock CspA family protein
MDRIVESFLEDFKSEFNYSHIDKSKLFENFINYIIVSKLYPDRLSVDKINVGGTRNPGIDGLAVMVNGHLVTSQEEVDYFIDDTSSLEVDFHFVQSKTSESFDMGSINTFIASVKEFFKDGELDFEDELLNLRDLKNYIYRNSIKMEKSPSLNLYYATTGKWLNDKNLSVTINSGLDELKKSGLFSKIKFNPIDSDKIKSLYREIKNKITKEIIFEKHTILPKIDKVTESYLGIIPASELLAAICDDDGDIIKTIFYDNVRDFQGFNKVNSGIRSSLESADFKDKFLLMNNGITLVARSLNKVGSAFKISDFQIVNGCQTSHVLHNLKRLVDDKVYIPLKLIVTDNDDVTNEIIKATNSQTEVKNEAFEILRPFHKKLEEFYLTYEKFDNKRVFYERRSRQFITSKTKKEIIISLSTQISSFVAMFLNEPQSTHRYFGELLKAYDKKLFIDNHSFYPYYTSGLALGVVEGLYRENILHSSLKIFKYHLLLMLRIHIAGEKIPINVSSNKEIEKYCNKICEVLWDRENAKNVFLMLEGKLKQALENTSVLKRQAHSIRAFTEELIPVVASSKKEGELSYYNSVRGFGFLRLPNTEEDIFVHFSELQKNYHEPLLIGLKFSFEVHASHKGLQATNVEIII